MAFGRSNASLVGASLVNALSWSFGESAVFLIRLAGQFMAGALLPAVGVVVAYFIALTSK